jgi:hypothetical protein
VTDGDHTTAWPPGLRPVHLGNVAEYNAQFIDSPIDVRSRPGWLTDCHHYANLAMFYSPHPAVVITPRHVDRSWVQTWIRQLEWDPVDVYTGVTAEVSLSAAVAQRPALLERISGLPLRPWGRTPEFEQLLASEVDHGNALDAGRRFDSKSAANALFAGAAENHPRVVVPRQRALATRRATARAVAERAAAGESAVLKADHGVGGQGTAVITPHLVAQAGGAAALLRQILPRDWFHRHGVLLIEQYIDRVADLTFDAIVDDNGDVRTVGTGAMIIDGTRYRGVTVGPGVVAPDLDRAMRSFGLDVGRILAAHGYRGWFDVDFVADGAGRVAPTEINTRHTGPTVAFALQARLDQVRGAAHVVRTLDRLPLKARLPEDALFVHMRRIAADCTALGADLVTTVPTASYEEPPYVGVALAARTVGILDAAERLVRQATASLAGLVVARA